MEGPQKKTKNRLWYVPAIQPLGMYPDKSVIQKDTCTPMFTSSTTYKPGNGNSLCSLTDEWKKKTRCGNFPGGLLAKSLHSQCREPGFNPWPAN